MDAPRIAYILPSYQCFNYSRWCLQSLFAYTPHAIAIVVDDASAAWQTGWMRDVGGPVTCFRFERNGGLTRSWNKGFEIAFGLDPLPEYVVAGNNDVLFTRHWHLGLIDTLRRYALTGPLSNAPGDTAKKLQQVSQYLDDYQVTDDPAYNDQVARRLLAHQGLCRATPVNGFFMMAKTATWRAGMFDGKHVFRPAVHIMPSGRRNRTPLMTGQEDELQARWRAQGMLSAVTLSSFIFHYRSVSRGKAFAKGDWYRPTQERSFDAPVRVHGDHGDGAVR